MHVHNHHAAHDGQHDGAHGPAHEPPHAHPHAHSSQHAGLHAGHHHHHAPPNMNRSFAIGVALNVGFVIVEAVAGTLANSLALLADAGHNLSDVLGLLLAWAAHRLATAKPSPQRTYGWKSSSILAAVFNAQILLVAIGGIVWEAWHRFVEPAPSGGATIVWVATAGVLVNTFTALLFIRGQQSDLNIRGAFLHMAADAAVSVGVVIAGVAIAATGYLWIDPLTSLIVAGVILLGTWGLLRESLDLALHAVPRHIDTEAVKHFLSQQPGVTEVHDLHIWAMSTTEAALTAHLVKPVVGDDDALLATLSRELSERFSIGHVTLQIERAAAASNCPQASNDVV